MLAAQVPLILLYELMTDIGCAALTAISNPLSSISRRARSPTTELLVLRLVSCELAAKCLIVTPTPGMLWTPSVVAAAVRPETSGSSE